MLCVTKGFVDVGFSWLTLLSCLILRDLTGWVWVNPGGGGGRRLSHAVPRRTSQSPVGGGHSLSQVPPASWHSGPQFLLRGRCDEGPQAATEYRTWHVGDVTHVTPLPSQWLGGAFLPTCLWLRVRGTQDRRGPWPGERPVLSSPLLLGSGSNIPTF